MMPTEVIMPQIGETVVSGTIVKWLKEIGDQVAVDESLVEIATDKANVEIPSPAAGVLQKKLAEEGEEVKVGGLLAIISAPGEKVAEVPGTATVEKRPEAASKTAEPQAPSKVVGAQFIAPKEERKPEKKAPSLEGEKAKERETEEERIEEAEAARPVESEEGIVSAAERRLTKSSPLVRRMAKEHGVNLADVTGSGLDGRVTKEDILDYVARRQKGIEVAPKPVGAQFIAPKEERKPEKKETAPKRPADQALEDLEEVIPLEGMRKAIAEHMARSKRTSPHVTTVAEADMSEVSALREKNKEAFRQKYGVSLTFLPFIIAASVQALKEFPYLNSSLVDDRIILKRYYHVGVSVQTERGLMTPVIRNADRLGVEDLAKAVDSLARRAREGRLSLNEIQGGTFSITNPGSYGAILSTPIINQPQAAILGAEKIEKRAVVVDDAIAIRPMMYLCLSYDHRIVDGATSIQFLQRVRALLEAGKFEIDVCL
ncbi:2-oxo acid dehydrogenase subunit E2 [Candidatus Poribacteria bacterium]|nr:2-oxo acid dehydrogenase subunit E2 [Candidatus Poribacteria bacterium]